MPPPKASFLDKVLGRINRLDNEGLQSVIKRLARERAFLETLFNSIEDGVLVLDAGGRVLQFNPAVTTLLGLQAGRDEGRPVGDVLPNLDWAELRRVRRGAKRVQSVEFEVEWPRPRFLRLSAAPLDESTAEHPGLALIIHDATEARQQTFEAIESERLRALTLLAASVAHEIGNPLNALHIHLQLMERELRKLRTTRQPGTRKGRGLLRAKPDADSAADLAALTDKMEGYLTVARGEISRLDYIVSQFLQAIRPSRPALAPASLNTVVGETLALLRPELENRGLRIEERLAPTLPDAPLDAAQIKQVLVNLIKNSMQAMTRGGTLALETGEGMDGVWVSVGDTGGGISPEQINRIFEPFYTTKERGSGLGLMIVQRIVREHGGQIGVQSDPGDGTRVKVWLPLTERPTKLLAAKGETSG